MITSDGFPALRFFSTRDSNRRTLGTFVRPRLCPSARLLSGLRLVCVDAPSSAGGAETTFNRPAEPVLPNV